MFFPKHLEARPGEILLTFATCKIYKEIGWKTKRLGTAFTKVDGALIYPVFVQEEEFRQSRLWRKDTDVE